MESGQQQAWHRGKLEEWEFPSFPAPPGKVQRARARASWGSSGHLTGGRAGVESRKGRCGVEQVSLFALCDPVVWKHPPYLLCCSPDVQPSVTRAMAGYGPVLTGKCVPAFEPGRAGLASSTQRAGNLGLR